MLLDHGNRSAIEIQGRTGVWTLTPEPEERRTLMTRAAPRKVWFPVRAGGTLEAGSFRLTLPSPALASLPADASFLFTLQTGQGALELSADKVLLVAS